MQKVAVRKLAMYIRVFAVCVHQSLTHHPRTTCLSYIACDRRSWPEFPCVCMKERKHTRLSRIPPAQEKACFRGVRTRIGYREFTCQIGSNLLRCVAAESSHILPIVWTPVLTVSDKLSSSQQHCVSANTVISWLFYCQSLLALEKKLCCFLWKWSFPVTIHLSC